MDTEDLSRKLTAIFLGVMSVLVVSVISAVSEYESIADRKSYCELVSMWEEDAELGIEPTKRDGMPNYKGLECE